MTPADRTRERLRPTVEKALGFSGWRLDAFVAPKPLGPAEPWDYKRRAKELLDGAASVLDLGTGGGEVFEELCGSYLGRAFATESWHVNVPVAAERLGPRGIRVVRCHSPVLPFRDGVFELVLDRHEELDPREVARVLRPGGTILTQQVGEAWSHELREFFPRMQDDGDLFARYQGGLRDSGLRIVRAQTHDWKVAYDGLEDLVFLLCVTPWTIPGFDPLGGDLEALVRLEDTLSSGEGIVLTESRFIIEARKEP